MRNLIYVSIFIITSLNCKFFDNPEKNKFTVLELHDYSNPRTMLINDNETLMASISYEADFSLWDMNEKKQIFRKKVFDLKNKRTNYLEAEFVGGDKYIAVFYKDENKLFFFDIEKKRVTKEQLVNFDYASFSRNSSLIAIGRNMKNYIEVRNIFNWSMKCSITLKYTNPFFVISKEGNYLAININNFLSLYDVNKCKEIYSIPFSDNVNKLSIYEKESSLIVSYYPNYVNIIDLSTGIIIKKLQSQPYGTTTLVFSPDGKHIVTGGDDDDVSIWTREDFSFVKSIHFAQIYRIYYTQDSKSIFMMGNTNRIAIWDLTKEKFYSEQNGENK